VWPLKAKCGNHNSGKKGGITKNKNETERQRSLFMEVGGVVYGNVALEVDDRMENGLKPSPPKRALLERSSANS